MQTGRTKHICLREIIGRRLEDMEDYHLAAEVLKRIREGGERVYSAAEVKEVAWSARLSTPRLRTRMTPKATELGRGSTSPKTPPSSCSNPSATPTSRPKTSTANAPASRSPSSPPASLRPSSG